ncbi:hypothetical protein SHIRM173S_03867 [Streptomyces hirsutus]
MTRTRNIRPRRPLLAGTTAVAAMAVTAGLVAATAEPAKAAAGPKLSLIAATTSIRSPLEGSRASTATSAPASPPMRTPRFSAA